MSKLDIRFQSMNSLNPSEHFEVFTDEQEKEVIKELEAKYGHLADEINAVKGYIIVRTIGANLNGNPTPINFTPALLAKLHLPK